MFTGLVRTVGTIVQIRPQPEARTIVVASDLSPDDLALGASVSCAGVCLTVTRREDDRFEAEAAFETLRRTTLGARQVGDRLNLEPSLRVGDALGGHFVAGHVDGVGSLRRIVDHGAAREIWFDLPPDLMPFVAVKGSIAVDGVSLTINEVDRTGFMVGLVPHTLQVTTLGALPAEARVNIEVDVVARYVARLLESGNFPAHGSASSSIDRAPGST